MHQLADRTRSDPDCDPMTGAELGMAGAADPSQASLQASAAGGKAKGKTTRKPGKGATR